MRLDLDFYLFIYLFNYVIKLRFKRFIKFLPFISIKFFIAFSEIFVNDLFLIFSKRIKNKE